MIESLYKDISEKSRQWIVIGVCVALILALYGIGLRIFQFIRLKHATEQQATLTVSVIEAKSGPRTEEIILPATVLGWHESAIYARINGYVTKWLVDIGSKVKRGDLLAVISAPEVNAQLRQTKADLKTAEANNNLAQRTAVRWKHLLKTDSVSKQETDDKVSNAEATAAIVKSTRANRDRLRDLVSYERVIAPFDGVISYRNTDIGNLINAGSSGTVTLFRLIQSNRLRIYVSIPQYYSPRINRGLTTQLFFREYPGKFFTAKLLDSAHAIDTNTRTLLTQFEIDNANYQLKPGSYTEVHFILPAMKNNVRLPVNTLIFRAQGLQVATLDKQNRVELKRITISRDFGDEVEIASGVQPGESIILNPPDSLFGGEKVRVVSAKATTQGSKSS